MAIAVILWGGVEIGGVLFGKNESGTVQISSVRPAECEHHYGPAFDLSTKDFQAFGHLLTLAEMDGELAGLTPVGWYQSTSRRDLGMSDHARAFLLRVFPAAWQVAMVLTCYKRDPPFVAMLVHDSKGGVELHSPAQEFIPNVLQQGQAPSSAPE